MDVPLDARRDPSPTDDRVRRKTDANYRCRINTCLVDSVVSLNPLGLFGINIHIHANSTFLLTLIWVGDVFLCS